MWKRNSWYPSTGLNDFLGGAWACSTYGQHSPEHFRESRKERNELSCSIRQHCTQCDAPVCLRSSCHSFQVEYLTSEGEKWNHFLEYFYTCGKLPWKHKFLPNSFDLVVGVWHPVWLCLTSFELPERVLMTAHGNQSLPAAWRLSIIYWHYSCKRTSQIWVGLLA